MPLPFRQERRHDQRRDQRHDKNRATRQSRAGRFWRDRAGTSALEFALVAPIFFGLTFSILEAGLYFFINSAVDAANAKAARLIRTGQTQGGAISREAFFDEVCEVVTLFGDCGDKLTVDVARFDDFAALAADIADPVCKDSDPSKGEPDPNDMSYNGGAARDIIRVRVCYLYESFTPGLGLQLEDAAGGAHKMISTVIFRNEPFASAP
ncbi:MAG: TadE/TadG family type IV pilus assembly protein [Pseudomonadota bacterium]